jgi:hypothetical protein
MNQQGAGQEQEEELTVVNGVSGRELGEASSEVEIHRSMYHQRCESAAVSKER